MQQLSPSPLQDWALTPSLIHLSHGSYGALPRVVQEEVSRYQRELEERPDSYLFFTAKPILAARRDLVGARYGAAPGDLVLTPGASAGMTTVLRSFPWTAGDEVLYSDHGYRLVENCLLHLAKTRGIVPRRVSIALPVAGPEDFIAAFRAGITARTKLIVTDHIASPTALVFPVEDLVLLAREHGLPILVDGAHAPGHVDLDLAAVGADFYVGNLHKWVAGPRGTGFLHATAKWHEGLEPLVITAHEGTFAERFLWSGTGPLAPFLALDVALAHDDTMQARGYRSHAHALLKMFRAEFVRLFAATPPCPDDPAFYGNMHALPLPPRWKGDPASEIYFRKLFFEKHGIEVPFTSVPAQETLHVRPSAHAYTSAFDMEKLLAALREEFL